MVDRKKLAMPAFLLPVLKGNKNSANKKTGIKPAFSSLKSERYYRALICAAKRDL